MDKKIDFPDILEMSNEELLNFINKDLDGQNPEALYHRIFALNIRDRRIKAGKLVEENIKRVEEGKELNVPLAQLRKNGIIKEMDKAGKKKNILDDFGNSLDKLIEEYNQIEEQLSNKKIKDFEKIKALERQKEVQKIENRVLISAMEAVLKEISSIKKDFFNPK